MEMDSLPYSCLRFAMGFSLFCKLLVYFLIISHASPLCQALAQQNRRGVRGGFGRFLVVFWDFSGFLWEKVTQSVRYRWRMTTTWARVAVDRGERVVSLVPEMISWLTAQIMGVTA